MKKFLCSLLILLSISAPSYAFLSFTVNSEDIPKTKILFLGFDNKNPNLQRDGFEILERIKKNLRTTDLFDVITQNSTNQAQNQPLEAAKPGINLAQESFNIEALPDFEKYNKIGVGAIVIAQFNYDKVGNLEARIRMWDVLDQKQLFGKFYTASRDSFRKMANTISDEIFKAISGEKLGHFNSQIVYVAESGPGNHRIKQLATIEFDGTAHHILTNPRDLVLTPIFSKNPHEIYYVKYFEQRPQIFNLDLRTLRNKKVGGFRGTNFAAAVNPLDSNKILLSAIVDDNSDIYELNIAENSAMRLTKTPAIDTTPSYSPDGKLIAFTSDRDSGQQIYIMGADGSSVKRISSGSASYSKPIFSPDGKLLAYTKMKGGQFFIGTMKPDGSAERVVSSGYLVEGARWSQNGRYLVFSKKKEAYGKGNIPRLHVADVVTGFEFQLPTPEGEGATDPDWR